MDTTKSRREFLASVSAISLVGCSLTVFLSGLRAQPSKEVRDVSGVTAALKTDGRWRNWSRLVSSDAETIFPRTTPEVVAAVLEAEARNKRVRAAGSRWSFDDCARPDHISVDLSLMPGSFRNAGFLHSSWRLKLRGGGSNIVLANAGAPLWKLNEDLWRNGFSLMTLGGSQGQSLAGAISTGTHGTDLDFSSLADSVHAIHLVGSGGKEYWIEPSDGVTDPDRMWAYNDWDDSIEQIRDDNVFKSTLVSVGRFGIIVAVLLEVAPKYNLEEHREHSSWPEFVSRLINLKNTGDFQGLHDDEIRAIKIDLDPYARGHGYLGALSVRTIASDHGAPIRPVAVSSKGPDAQAREVDATIAVAWTGKFIPFAIDAFGAAARAAFKGERSERHVIDRNYFVTSDRPHQNHTYAQHYVAFNRHGPLVYSMEYFFDGTKTDAIDFVDAVYAEWNGFHGGYIAIRFARKSAAMIGPQKFDLNVIVEVTIIQGYPDSKSLRHRVKTLASELGAVPHWGQEHWLSPPEVQAHYKKRVSIWRDALKVVSRVGKSGTFSNIHSRRLGLEPTPALMISYEGRIRAWFDRRRGVIASGFVPFAPFTGGRVLFFKHSGGTSTGVGSDGLLRTVPVTSPNLQARPGSLILRRKSRDVCEFRPEGTVFAKRIDTFRPWMQ